MAARHVDASLALSLVLDPAPTRLDIVRANLATEHIGMLIEWAYAVHLAASDNDPSELGVDAKAKRASTALRLLGYRMRSGAWVSWLPELQRKFEAELGRKLWDRLTIRGRWVVRFCTRVDGSGRVIVPQARRVREVQGLTADSGELTDIGLLVYGHARRVVRR